MYVLDGIVYAGNPEPLMEVTSVKPLPDKILLITFASGETRVFDASILSGEVFEKLNDADVFNNVYVDNGVVTWDNGEIDCAPEFMYKSSYAYETQRY